MIELCCKKVNKMFILSCVLLLMNICYSNQTTIISRFDIKDEFKVDNQTDFFKLFPAIDSNHDPIDDVNLTTPQLITKYGYKAETHYVTTEDGYILELHRITGKLESSENYQKKSVCLLQHGILSTSASWILTGPDHALGYRLSNENYDVWLANSRGTFYGCNHTKLNPFGSSKDRKQFWSFSFHEMGMFDLPAVIDYVLKQTGASKLQYVGHSQGTASFFVLASQKPEYNKKIELMHALAPIAFMSHVISPPIRALAPFVFTDEEVLSLIGMYYVNPTEKFLQLSEEKLCRDKAPTQIICKSLLFLISGYTSDQLNTTLLPLILGYPASVSVDQLLHFGQEVRSGHFRQFDYGYVHNLIRYKRLTPPDYNLSNIRAPIAFYCAHDDWLADPRDIAKLLMMVPNVLKHYLIPHLSFNHLDFLYGIDAQHLVYDEVLKTMKSNESQFGAQFSEQGSLETPLKINIK